MLVFANGHILMHADTARCLAETGAEAVMSAEEQLCTLYTPFSLVVMGWVTPAVRRPGSRVLGLTDVLPPTRGNCSVVDRGRRGFPATSAQA